MQKQAVMQFLKLCEITMKNGKTRAGMWYSLNICPVPEPGCGVGSGQFPGGTQQEIRSTAGENPKRKAKASGRK